MAVTQALEAFSRFAAKWKLPRTAPVAVAVSGGSDSVALTYLARQLFDRVVGITIDHRLREESLAEALKTREVVTKMGAEHHILPLEWERRPPPGKVQMWAREKRYPALLTLCTELGIKVLMTAHHQDDQIETFIHCLAKGSRIDGLAGIPPVTAWPSYRGVKIMRPLLNCTKESLVGVCREQSLEWVEDPSNATPIYRRNVIRRVLAEHPELSKELLHAIKLCGETKEKLDPQVVDAVKYLPKINRQYGYLIFPLEHFLQLNPTVGRRALSALVRYIGQRKDHVHFESLQKAYRSLQTHSTRRVRNISLGKCNIAAMKDDRFIIARQLPPNNERPMTPIRVGETIQWDHHFEITLKPLGTSQPAAEPPTSSKEFFVRHMDPRDWEQSRKGVRKVKRFLLPPEHARGGLPVIVDGQRRVVLIPHFKVLKRSAGVICDVTFKPALGLWDIVNVHCP